MTSDEIRSTFIDFFVEHEHKLLSSAPLVPQHHDPSVLLTTAGMHPLKPYFQELATPPAKRLTSCQKCFRTTDIENVGATARHLTFFEMLGNFSLGDYFKHEAVEFAWELATQGFGFAAGDIWVTVHKGDDALGLGPDEEAIAAWHSVGVPDSRIVLLGSDDNFWQAGPTGPSGPCSELYLDRGEGFGGPQDRPGDDTERFLEFWNLVFMQFDQGPPGTLTALPNKNIDTGMGLNRMAAILQDVPSVFETDQFRPLIDLGQELSGRQYGSSDETTRALRILADHSRAMAFLVADGVVPSNEERGYILRRLMRRAIGQGRVLGLDPGYLPRYADVVTEIMGAAYPELVEQRAPIQKWLASEEEGFGRTLEHGIKLLDELIDRAQAEGRSSIAASDAFALHDTFGFPFDLTREMLGDVGLEVDAQGFEDLMEAQRTRARAGVSSSAGKGDDRQALREFASAAGFVTEFTGYARTEQTTTVGAIEEIDGRLVAKLVESPFYAAGGGQISDVGFVVSEDGLTSARVQEVVRLEDDQALSLSLEEGELTEGQRVIARVDPSERRATIANHTATHLLHAALREQVGTHVRQAGSYVGPDKLRFDFTHGQSLTPTELKMVEDQVNGWILENAAVRAIVTTISEAKRLGAMALFGEKYGDIVRMVEVGDGSHSRELCGGIHVSSTAEIGLFTLVSESSSGANVRRIEAITGPVAIRRARDLDRIVSELVAQMRVTPDEIPQAVRQRDDKIKDLEREARSDESSTKSSLDLDALVAKATSDNDAVVLAEVVGVADDKQLLVVLDQVKGRIGDSVIVLGCAVGDRVAFVASVAPSLVQRGVKAGEVVRVAAEIAGGGGGGRDTMARAGGSDPSKLDEAIAAARAAVQRALST